MVKSPPELWAELSEVESLERHLGEFGEIRITRSEPETTVAWEGENASGTVELEPTGWGTKVTITAAVAVEAEAAEPELEPVAAEPEPEPVAAEPEPVAERDSWPLHLEPDPLPPGPVKEPERRGFFARFFSRKPREAPPGPPAYTASQLPEEPELPLPAQSALEPPPQPEPRPEPEPVGDAVPDDADFEFDFAIRRGEEQPEVEEPPRGPLAPERAKEVLETALENLGQAHHRPFSRD